jgi:hypothetical protein
MSSMTEKVIFRKMHPFCFRTLSHDTATGRNQKPQRALTREGVRNEVEFCISQ